MKRYTINFKENDIPKETVIYAECLENALSILFANYKCPFITSFRSDTEKEYEEIPF